MLIKGNRNVKKANKHRNNKQKNKRVSKFFAFITFIFIGIYVYSYLYPSFKARETTYYNSSTSDLETQNYKNNFTCSGKIYCSEMISCAEAYFYLNNCPGTKLDGNNDGEPCERQWCK